MANQTRKKPKHKAKKKQVILEKGNIVRYRSKDGFFIYAEIVAVHREDIPPYYTIKTLDDNIEIQTVRSRLSAISGMSPDKQAILRKKVDLDI